MTTKTESPTEKARRITEDQIEAIGFDLSRNAQQTVASIEERHDLLRRRENLLRLYQMLGGDPARIAAEPEKNVVAR
jgi:hypothetical protein